MGIGLTAAPTLKKEIIYEKSYEIKLVPHITKPDQNSEIILKIEIYLS